MTKPDRIPRLHDLSDLEDTLREHRSACRTDLRARATRLWRQARRFARRPAVRKAGIGVGAVFAVFAVGIGALWLRLAFGPIELNFLSPLFASAVEQTIGTDHRVAVAGAQIERDESGRAAIRLLDMKVRDAAGAVVASAPKAEVSFSGVNLLRGQMRARRVSLVGAELSVRIEDDGQLTISAGGEKNPLAVTPAIIRPAPAAQPGEAAAAQNPNQDPSGTERFIALMAWLDRVSALGLDGKGLGEIGLKNGVLRVDDQRTDKHWTFPGINFSINKPGDGIDMQISSEDATRPWKLFASIRQSGFQRKLIRLDLDRVNTKDLFLATRLGDGQFQADVPLSGNLRAEIGPDSLPRLVEGKITADAGLIGDPNDPGGHVRIDRAEFTLDWDANRRNLTMPFQIFSGANRITLISRFEAPSMPGDPWQVVVTGGSVVLSEGASDPHPVVLNKVLLRGKIDPARRRLELVQGDLGGAGASGVLNGLVDFSGSEPRLAVGFALTPMSSAVAKKVWPIFIATKVRNWVAENLLAGDIERVDIATNAPIDTLREGGPPIPADGLSVEVSVRNATIRPVEGMPAISEADLKTIIKGRNVVVQVARGVVDLGGGKKLNVSGGRFEVPDTHPKAPPARAQFRVEGAVPAALELLQSERIRGQAALPMDAGNSRGNLTGTVTVNLPITADPAPGATQYQIALDVAGFVADKMAMGHKIEAQALKVSATNQGYQIKGDVRINGVPATLEYGKAADATEADIRIQATLDEAARARFGFAAGSGLSGPLPIKIAGKVADNKDMKLQVEVDLTPTRIDNLLPGWIKPAGRAGRASFTLVSHDKTTRLDNLVIDGSGVNVRGNVELNASGDLVSANFPVFALSDGDKASVKAERGADGVLKVVMRGDVYDGRGFVKSFFGGGSGEKPQANPVDLDADIKVGAIAGHNGEALRGVELKMSRRGGQIRAFTLHSKLGREAALTGEIRAGGQRKQVLYFETVDAGALMRFTDIYPRLHGGQMWVAMDVPTPDQTPQDGIINMRDFTIRGEPALKRVVGAQQGDTHGVDFTRLKVDFTRTPGKMVVKEGEVRGPTVGATMDGVLDFVKNDVRMRGTFVPLYGINNAFGQIPLVGLFLGGQKEGLLGITFEVTGPPSAPTLRINPISAVAPGLLRKFFEFPTSKPPEPFEPGPATANSR